MLTASRDKPAAGARALQSIALLLLLALTSGADAERLPIKSYTTADGLVNNRIGRIVCDSHGFLWFCTSNGVSRFDGSRFKSYGVDDGLPIGATYDLLETRNGTYWIATNGGGVARFKFSSERVLNQGETASRFTIYSLGDTPVANRVNKLFEDSSGTIWAGTDGGLFSLNEQQGEVAFHSVELGVPSHPDLTVQVWAFVENSDGSLWIGTKFGLVHRLLDGRMLHYDVDPSPVSDVVFSLVKDSDDNLWVTHNTGVFVCKFPPDADAASQSARRAPSLRLPDSARHYTRADGLGGNNTVSLFKSRSGAIWLADTSSAINEFDGKSFRSYSLKQFIGTDPPTSVAEDNDGNLWIGTGANGVLRFAPQGFVTYGTNDGLGEYIVSIFENHAGELIVSSREWLLNRFDGKAFVSVKINLPRPVIEAGVQRSSAAIIEDHTGEWWVGTRVGLYRFAKVNRLEELATAQPKAVYLREQGLASDDINSLFEDSRGDIWIASFAPGRDVLTRWERATETFHRYSEADGLRPFTSPSSFAEDRAGNIWIGIREGGLARYVNGTFVVFGEAEGFPRSVVSIYLDQFGRLWCTLFEGRVFRIDHPEASPLNIVQYTRKDGIGNQLFSSIVADVTGRIYVAGPQDITQIDPVTGHIKHFTATDGLGIGDAARAFRDRQGSLWFGGSRGLSRYTPQPERDRLPPPIYIDELRIAGLSHQVSPVGESLITDLVMQPNQNNIQIDFFGLSFGLGELLRYQYKLEGSTADWSEPGDTRSVNYANLAPGAYRFLVRAVNSIGATSDKPAVVAFRILPPVYKRWWFIGIGGLVIAAVVFAFVRYRYQRTKAVIEAQDALRRSREERLDELERVRTRIATDLHDDIGSSLTQIAILSEVAHQRVDGGEPGQGLEPLTRIISVSNELVDTMSDIVWAINPRKDHLSDLLQRMRRFASDIFTARGIALRFVAPDAERDIELSANVRREVFLIFKESVNNVVKHSGCTRAEVEFHLEGDWLRLKISDNGKGFDTALGGEAGTQNVVSGKGGNGLLSIRKRAQEMNGRFEITSRVGEGTIATLRVPATQQREEKK